MHDTLRYMKLDPVHRSYDHHDMTFGLLYAFSERFVLPLSHDEVVHGKGSLIGRMPGDTWQRFANLRAYFAFMWTQPGKKLLFMGGEFGQDWEWNHDGHSTGRSGASAAPRRAAAGRRSEPAVPGASRRCTCSTATVQAFAGSSRRRQQQRLMPGIAGARRPPPVIAVCNFTPVPRLRYRHGRAARWCVARDPEYRFGNLRRLPTGNGGRLETSTHPSHGQPFSLELTLPPLATILLRHGG